jgi:hypothetical protein
MSKTKVTIPQTEEKAKPTEQVVFLSPSIKNIYYTTRASKAERLKVRMYSPNGSYIDHTIFAWAIVNREAKNGKATLKLQEVVPVILMDGQIKVYDSYREDPDVEIIDEKYEDKE